MFPSKVFTFYLRVNKKCYETCRKFIQDPEGTIPYSRLKGAAVTMSLVVPK